MRNGYVNADGGGGRGGRGKEIHRDIEGSAAGEIRNSLGWLKLYIMFGAN